MGETLIEINNLTHRYHYEPYTLFENLCITIEKGQKCGILIDRLEGKTTLAKLMCGIIKPQKGEILLENERVSNCDNGIAVLWSDFALMQNRSVKANLKFVLKIRKVKQAEPLVEKAINERGLKEFENTKVKRLDEKTKLSVALARLSLRKIKLLIIDGVLGKLSLDEAKVLEEFLSSFKTVVILDKELSSLKICDNVTIVKDKHAVFCGAFEQAQGFTCNNQ